MATLAACTYAFPLDRLVQALKYEHRLALAEPLGDALAAAVLRAPASYQRPDALIAVPLAAARQRERGFNQAIEIARVVARRTGFPLVTGLVRTGNAPAQATLPWTQRRRNVRGAFACATAFAGRHVALVDDVMTTGATLEAAAAALLQCGCGTRRCMGRRAHASAGERVVFAVVLVQPEIPPNTGNVIRLTANTATELHLVEPLGFRMDDRELKRAGLDYHEYARVRVHEDFAACRAALDAQTPRRWFALTTRAAKSLYDEQFMPGDVFVFGRESTGLPIDIVETFPPGQRLRIPMRPGVRSLNLSNAVAVAVYEAWRQQGFVAAGGNRIEDRG